MIQPQMASDLSSFTVLLYHGHQTLDITSIQMHDHLMGNLEMDKSNIDPNSIADFVQFSNTNRSIFQHTSLFVNRSVKMPGYYKNLKKVKPNCVVMKFK